MGTNLTESMLETHKKLTSKKKPWRPEGLTPPTADSDVEGWSPDEIYFLGVDDAVKMLKKWGNYYAIGAKGWQVFIPDEGGK